ncbi:hypothetical protein BG011_008730 [Mortierella polycephala]|uniref:Uncharacterized protein n=1 Tax=Mortierella polycephala TaxID=41804 RepID=A0A9P6PPI7_9FUNG|nr:hypothetical protein BG011_008730 [Mortierella polycephala]
MTYNQYGQSYGMPPQHSQHQGYAYGQPQPQLQQGFPSQGYATEHQQSPYAQSYPTSHQAYSQQPHYSQPYSTAAPHNRHLPPPVSSQGHSIDHQQHLAQQQQLAQQQRIVQQQQLVQQQYLAQQQQLAQQQIQHQQLTQSQPPHQPSSSYHQRNLSQSSQGSTYQSQPQQQSYPPHSPVSIVASQPYASMNPPYQQQPYAPSTSMAYSASGHAHSLSNASSHGSVSTMTNTLEGVGLGLSGMTNVEHGRVGITPATVAGTDVAYTHASEALSMDTGSNVLPSPLPKIHHSAEYMTTKRQRLDSEQQQVTYGQVAYNNGGSSGSRGGNGQENGVVNSYGVNATVGIPEIANGINGNGNGALAPVVLPGIDALTDPLNRSDVEVSQ